MISKYLKSAILGVTLTTCAWSQEIGQPVKDVDIFRPERRETKVELVDSTSNSLILNVDVFADGFIGTYYILWDQMDDISDDIKKMITSRDFARDEFFMQNIDREQFEQERMLQLFEDRKQEYFKIFPEEALKMLEDEHKDD